MIAEKRINCHLTDMSRALVIASTIRLDKVCSHLEYHDFRHAALAETTTDACSVSRSSQLTTPS
jgi:hypothetical protein